MFHFSIVWKKRYKKNKKNTRSLTRVFGTDFSTVESDEPQSGTARRPVEFNHDSGQNGRSRPQFLVEVQNRVLDVIGTRRLAQPRLQSRDL